MLDMITYNVKNVDPFAYRIYNELKKESEQLIFPLSSWIVKDEPFLVRRQAILRPRSKNSSHQCQA